MGMNSRKTPLRPSFWRTCRVIACESRLRLLWALFEAGELSVSELAYRTGMGSAQASLQLRALNARGLITFRREKMRVLYRAEANELTDFAARLLEGLHVCYARKMRFSTVIRQATAFTHSRRIEIVRILQRGSLSSDELLLVSGMSSSALSLHLRKLVARGFVMKADGKYSLSNPANRFGRVLFQVVLSDCCRVT
jgi:DNA-binding transcriptional ArsR family regulator